MSSRKTHTSILYVLLSFLFTAAVFLGTSAVPCWSAPFFEDGYLGLTQAEVRTKLGTPHAVRARQAALRVFHYYSFSDWQKYFEKLVSPENGEDVYTYNRNGVQVRYSFVYTPDLRDQKEFPTLHVKRVEVEFTPPATIEQLPGLVNEFVPPTAPNSPVFRSNLWILIFKGQPAANAPIIVNERDKEKWKWSLAYQLFSVTGLPDYLTPDVSIDRLEFTTQSLAFVKQRQKLTHEPILNPYSKEFANLPPQPAKPQKAIPVPRYAE